MNFLEKAIILSDKDLLLLVNIIKDLSNKSARWNAFKNSGLLKKFEVDCSYTKTDFLSQDGIEATLSRFLRKPRTDSTSLADARQFLLDAIPELDTKSARYHEMLNFISQTRIDAIEVERIRLETLRTETEKRRIEAKKYGRTLEEEQILESEIGRAGVERLNKRFKDDEMLDKIGAGLGVGLGTIVLVPIALVILFIFGFFDPTPKEIAEIKRQEDLLNKSQLANCTYNLTQSITSSCASDPVFTYCSHNYDNNSILGSGCTSVVERQGSFSRQIAFCQQESLKSVREICLIEIHGCAAVTGKINC